MDIHDIYGGDWLRAEHLPKGIDVPVTIQKIDTDEFEDREGKKKKQIVLQFVGKERRLGLNITNAKMIASMHGSNTDDWLGKTIKLYVTKTEAFGDVVDCIRVRHEEPAQVQQTPPDQYLDGTAATTPPVQQPAPTTAPGGRHEPINPDDIPF